MKKLNSLRRLSVFALFGLLAIPFNSCTDLDTEVFSELTPVNFPANSSEVTAAFAGVYSTLFAMGNHGNYASTYHISADDVMIPHRGADWEDGGNWLRCHSHEGRPIDSPYQNSWNQLYRGALQANEVINLLKTDNAVSLVDEATRNLFTAELRAIRAYYYLLLLDGFGDVPLISDDTEFNPQPARTPRAEVFDFVVRELEEASGSLSRETGVSTYGRFNYFAAQALLSRAYLNAEVYTGTARLTEAIAAANNVINGNAYSLTDDYHANFAADNDNGGNSTSELILAIPFDATTATGFNLHHMTLHYQNQSTFQLQEQPWNGYCSLQEFYESYDEEDLRRGVPSDVTIPGNLLVGQQFAADGSPLLDGSAQDPDGETVIFTAEVNELAPGAFRQAGARIRKYQPSLGDPNSLSNDMAILRYAEVLLNKAEALHRQSPGNGEALMLVNMVRSRAYGNQDNNFTSLTDENLLAERGREMFYELTRRSDLIRFGKYTEPWFGKLAGDQNDLLWPIPQIQLNGNRNLTQNPGYN